MRWTTFLILIQRLVHHGITVGGVPSTTVSGCEEDPDHAPLAVTCPSPVEEVVVEEEEATGHAEDCQDSHPECTDCASSSESCGLCHRHSKDNDKDVDTMARWFEMERSEPSSRMGVRQVLDGESLGLSKAEIEAMIEQALLYFEDYVAKNSNDEQNVDATTYCRNYHENCALWAALGECSSNPTYMESSCAPVCQSCHLALLNRIEVRCPLDPNAPKAWEPGSLNQMFERLTSEPYLSQNDVQILSSPGDGDDGGPWIITMENVITSDEAERLIELGNIEGYKQSMDVDYDAIEPDGSLGETTSTYRTSYNSWCQNDCYHDEVALRVIHRLSNLTGIDEANSEYLQLLRYEPGQYYLAHHDFIHVDVERQQGPRILTVFLYLNDVESGGQTEFTRLGLRVTPRKYRALIWPSVLDEAPNQVDSRTEHQALTVTAGVKYGANAWFHLHDFKTPNRNNCQG